MKSTIFLIVAASLLTTGCESTRNSKANPANWFGGPKKETLENDSNDALIPRKKLSFFRMTKDAVYQGQPIDKLSKLVADEVPGGLLIQVTGVAAKIGGYDGQLKLLDSTDASVREYQFDVLQPVEMGTGPATSRTISIAVFLTDQDLQNVDTIRVRGANNTLTTRP